MRIRGLSLKGDWRPAEAKQLPSILAPLPEDWIEQNKALTQIIRRPVLTEAPPSAPGHSKYEPDTRAIVVFDKGVYHDGKLDIEQLKRSIYHELGHSLIKSNPGIIRRWTKETRNDGFVDEYAKTSPEEDFCDSLSEFLIHKKTTRKTVPTKAAFISKLLASTGREKTAMHFLNGFSDEMTKVARMGIGRLARKATQSASGMRVAKGVALGGAGATAGAIAGSKSGSKSGYDKGTSDVMTVAQKARMMGRREGVLAYHRALMKHQGGKKA